MGRNHQDTIAEESVLDAGFVLAAGAQECPRGCSLKPAALESRRLNQPSMHAAKVRPVQNGSVEFS